jgi:hypothetical protein
LTGTIWNELPNNSGLIKDELAAGAAKNRGSSPKNVEIGGVTDPKFAAIAVSLLLLH